MAWIKRSQVADFFLNEEHVYSKKRTIKMKHVVGVLVGLAVTVFILGAYYDEKAKREQTISDAQKEVKNSSTPPSSAEAAAPTTPSQGGYLSLSSSFSGTSARAGRTPAPSKNATQIIQRGQNSADVLPLGSSIPAQLIGRVESADSSSPVRAVILEDVLSPVQALVIPKGSKIIGSGQLDPSRERLQVRFHTLVFPEGEQYGISGVATMPDGSSGLAGDFSSGAFKRNASQIIGTFISGVAEGLKDRSAVGAFGIPLESGGIKNGLLNGVVDSSQSYAKTKTEEMGRTGASIRVPAGLEFALFLDREFHQ